MTAAFIQNMEKSGYDGFVCADESSINHSFNFESDNFNLETLYKVAVLFYKEKQGTKALVISYRDRLKLLALIKQVRVGPFQKHLEVGFLDFVGNDRSQAWKTLGNMTRETAMAEFVKSLIGASPQFIPFIKAQLTNYPRTGNENLEIINFPSKDGLLEKSMEELPETLKDLRNFGDSLGDTTNLEATSGFISPADSHSDNDVGEKHLFSTGIIKHENPKQDINALADVNCLTWSPSMEDHRFNCMKEELTETFLNQIKPMLQKLVEIQYPGDKSKQRDSLKAMEERQLEQLLINCQYTSLDIQNSEDFLCNRRKNPGSISFQSCNEMIDASGIRKQVAWMQGITDLNELPMLELPSLWTKPCVSELKHSLKNDAESVLEVGSGEIVTVRVPTHDGGSCLFWEFATDYYDIGFGIFFEWYVLNTLEDQEGIATEQENVVHNEANDDYIELDSSSLEPNLDELNGIDPPTEEVIQLSRLNSHEAVQCGSHIFPGPGVYLLKFDNSYSLWRSKKVYYRVFYTA